MPELDPEWEYYLPSEEVAELFDTTGGCETRFRLVDCRQSRDGNNPGFRWGKGNPDRCSFRLAPERPVVVRPLLPLLDCPVCGVVFRPERERQVYCCGRCYVPAGRHRQLADRDCDHCGVTFRPREAGRRYCSQGCGNRALRGVALAADRSDEWLEKLRSLWLGRAKAKDVCEALRCSLPTVKRYVRSMGLSRPSGRPAAKGVCHG